MSDKSRDDTVIIFALVAILLAGVVGGGFAYMMYARSQAAMMQRERAMMEAARAAEAALQAEEQLAEYQSEEEITAAETESPDETGTPSESGEQVQP